jgi:carboxymethylenebutenolidase
MLDSVIDPAAADLRAFAAREMTWTVATPDGSLSVIARAPSGPGPFPVIALFHHGPGMDDGTRAVMSAIANRGYFVVAPDRYYRTAPWMHFPVGDLLSGAPDSDQMRALLAVMADSTDDRMAVDVEAMRASLAAEPLARSGAMGVLGFCIGARTALQAMADHPDTFVAAALLHPSRCVEDGPDSPHMAVPDLPGEVYVAIGSADHMSPVELNSPLTRAVTGLGARGAVDIHAGVGHGFAVPGAGYHPTAASASYTAALAMFDRTLSEKGTPQ